MLSGLLTWSKPHAAQPAAAGGTVHLDTAWAGFKAAVHTDVTSVLFPILPKATPTITLRYLTRNSPHYRAYNDISLDRVSGAVVSHTLYASQSLGKQISIGMYSVHRGRVFGVAGTIVFMLAALMVSFFCITGYLLYLDRRRKKARARAASAGMFTEGPIRRYISE
jgi:sulfite reductase (NADPH) flavoprotein alpha-component